MSLPPLQYVTSGDGVRIAYFSLGNGTPIVFASNIFGDAHYYYSLDWQHVRGVTDKLVALGWRVIRHDVRGMGSSDRDVEDVSLDARVRDLEAVVERLGLERFALAGVDLGAATAMAYTVLHPERVTHLVLLSPWASGVRMFSIPDLRVVAATTARDDREWTVFANLLGSVATAFGAGDHGRQVADAIRRSTSPQGLAAYYKTSEAIELMSLLPQVAAPTLVIHEPAFPFGSFDLCREVAAAIRMPTWSSWGTSQLRGTYTTATSRRLISSCGRARPARPPSLGQRPVRSRAKARAHHNLRRAKSR